MLEPRYCLTNIVYVEHILETSDTTDVHGADLDGDMDVDLLAVSFSGDVVWYRNPGGSGGIGEP